MLHETDLRWLFCRCLHDCAFCRTPIPENDDFDRLTMMIQARVEKKDPLAINILGDRYYFGRLGLQKDARRAVELYTEAAELGSIEALFNLGIAYYYGDGVEQDKGKGAQFWTEAAMQGHIESRHNLGTHEWWEGSHDRAVRHLLISAKVGYKNSVEGIKKIFTMGIATKEQYAEARRGYQDAVEEMKSHDRDQAERNTRK